MAQHFKTYPPCELLTVKRNEKVFILRDNECLDGAIRQSKKASHKHLVFFPCDLDTSIKIK